MRSLNTASEGGVTKPVNWASIAMGICGVGVIVGVRECSKVGVIDGVQVMVGVRVIDGTGEIVEVGEGVSVIGIN